MPRPGPIGVRHQGVSMAQRTGLKSTVGRVVIEPAERSANRRQTEAIRPLLPGWPAQLAGDYWTLVNTLRFFH